MMVCRKDRFQKALPGEDEAGKHRVRRYVRVNQMDTQKEKVYLGVSPSIQDVRCSKSSQHKK